MVYKGAGTRQLRAGGWIPTTQEAKSGRRSSWVKGISKGKGEAKLETAMPLHEIYTVPFHSHKS